MNNFDCPSTSYFSTAEFNSRLYHWYSIINTPFNLLIIYLICFKSSEKMENVKSSLLILQICSAICDFSIGTLTVPFICFPAMAFWSNGVFTFLGVSPRIQAYYGIVMIGEVAATSVMMFENRYRHLKTPRGADSNKSRTILHYIINLSMPILLTSLTVLDVPSQENMKSSIFELQKLTNNTVVSELTRKLEKKFYYAVAAQSLLPFLVITIPATFFVFSMYTSYHNQAMNNFGMFLISTHGTVGSTICLLIHNDYRKFVSIGVFGITCNLSMIYIFILEKSERTSFNLICLFRAFFNNYILFGTFVLLFVPITILGYSPYSEVYETWNINLTNTFYLGNDFLSVLVAINRFVSLFFPMYYSTIWGKKITVAVLVLVYGYVLFALLSQMGNDIDMKCYLTFKPDELAWSFYSENEKCYQDGSPLLYLVSGILLTVFTLNILTFTKIVKFYKDSSSTLTTSRAKVKKNILLFFQTLLQDSLFVVDISFTFVLSTLSDSRFWTFLSGTLIWESVHSLDGFTMMMFNEKLSQIRKQFFTKSSVSDRPPISIASNLPTIGP